MMSFHFDELQARNGMKNLSGGLIDLIRPSKVAGIVVGNDFINWLGEL
jgi:hypothetical protein